MESEIKLLASLPGVKRMGPFILGKTIGKGTFGKVKKSINVNNEREYAIKILDRERVAQSETRIKRVLREVEILRRLNHPYVVRIKAAVSTEKYIYIVMEYVPGGELFDYIVAKGRLSEREARLYFSQLVWGVEYCHGHDVIHRDLKPENLLLDGQRNIKIVDFGLAGILNPEADMFLVSKCGSPHYAAPELVSGASYGPEVDIYSMGVILYALLTGGLPFHDPNPQVLFEKMRNEQYVVPSYVPTAAVDLIQRMLRTDPRKRATMKEIRNHPWVDMNATMPAKPLLQTMSSFTMYKGSATHRPSQVDLVPSESALQDSFGVGWSDDVMLSSQVGHVPMSEIYGHRPSGVSRRAHAMPMVLEQIPDVLDDIKGNVKGRDLSGDSADTVHAKRARVNGVSDYLSALSLEDVSGAASQPQRIMPSHPRPSLVEMSDSPQPQPLFAGLQRSHSDSPLIPHHSVPPQPQPLVMTEPPPYPAMPVYPGAPYIPVATAYPFRWMPAQAPQAGVMPVMPMVAPAFGTAALTARPESGVRVLQRRRGATTASGGKRGARRMSIHSADRHTLAGQTPPMPGHPGSTPGVVPTVSLMMSGLSNAFGMLAPGATPPMPVQSMETSLAPLPCETPETLPYNPGVGALLCEMTTPDSPVTIFTQFITAFETLKIQFKELPFFRFKCSMGEKHFQISIFTLPGLGLSAVQYTRLSGSWMDHRSIVLLLKENVHLRQPIR